MGDDIVTRLQRELEEIRRSGYGHDWPLSQAIAVIEAQQAEIERLRAAGDALARVVAIDIAVQLFGASSTHTQVAADRVKAWHEARRG